MSVEKWSVYMHTNKTNGKRYIGITSQIPEKRWLNGYGYAEHLPIGRAIRKYGWNGFEHTILISGVDEQCAKRTEIYMIRLFRTQDRKYGYNLTDGGDGVSGFRHSDSSKQKMSAAKSGVNHPNFGRHLPETTKAKIGAKSAGNKYALGCLRPAEVRKKMADAKKKPVVMYRDGAPICTFNSAKDAEAITGISRKNISMCCKNQRAHAGGAAWKFA